MARSFLFQVWFRRCVLGILLGAVLVGLFPRKIWTTSPAGFNPIIKVSALDLMQAWSLRRAALKAGTQNRGGEALYAWQAAIANNPADGALLRGFLQELLRHPPAKKYLAAGLNQTRWLLRLSRTNIADLELTTRVYHHCRVDDLLPTLLEPLKDRLSPELEAAYLKALFQQGAVEKFVMRLERLHRQNPSPGDPELELYHAAYLAGWGPPGAAAQGRGRLIAAMDNPSHFTLACRLKLAVSAHLNELDSYRDDLERLEQRGAVRLQDHIDYWQLLAAHGQKADAIRLLQAYPHSPVSGFEAVWLLRLYSGFELRDELLVMAKNFAEQFSFYEPVWLACADLAVAEKRWDDLRELALKIRTHRFVKDTLTGFSFYLEGRAEVAQQRHHYAAAAFGKAAHASFANPRLALSVAGNLHTLGYGQIAHDLLRPLANDLKRESGYWQLLLELAYEMKDSDLLATAAAGAYALAPDDAAAINNYAAALVINRQRPEKAVKLTWQLTQEMPGSSAARLNHALALLQNQRVAEAETWLATLSPVQLPASEATIYNLAQFEIQIARRRFVLARQVKERIDQQFLFPNQGAWLRQAMAKLPAGDPS